MSAAGRWKLLISLVIPIVGILALVVRAQVRLDAGTEWLLPIRGYDPRDLLSGHYLRFQYSFGELSDRQPCEMAATPGVCCVCLGAGSPEERMRPSVQLSECPAARACDGWIDSSALERLRCFYIPEGEGAHLERKVRDRKAAVLLSVDRKGGALIKDLYIDGVPWREAPDADDAEPAR